MPRRHFDDLRPDAGDVHHLAVPCPKAVPPGYTAVMFVTEWLTLNSRGDWACRVRGKRIHIRFVSETDRDRATARFMTPEVVNLLPQPRRSADRAAA
jgi:hypothetical protein